MTSGFILPFAIGVCASLQGAEAVLRDAFGVVAMVAMTPLLTIQMLGLVYQHKLKKSGVEEVPEIMDEEIVDL